MTLALWMERQERQDQKHCEVYYYWEAGNGTRLFFSKQSKNCIPMKEGELMAKQHG